MPSGCSMCGSPFCLGECQDRLKFTQLQQNLMDRQKAEMMDYMRRAMTGQPFRIPAMFSEEVPVKRKPLAEESVLCATGGLVGWRLWRIPCFGTTLLSINGAEWKPREALRASCNKGATKCLGVNCECGIYAWKKRENMEENESGYSCVKGEVWLWGKIVEHAKGYRAEYAYPKAFERSGDAERVAALYGVKLL